MAKALPALLALASGAAIAACSGAAQQAVDEPGPAQSSSSSSGSSSSASSSGASSSGGSSQDSGSFGAPAPSNCPPGAVIESGGNDTKSSALFFTSAACGTLASGGTDWWRFTLAGSATKLAVEYSGKVTLTASTQGGTFVVGSSDPVPFHPNADYYIQVTSQHTQDEPYVIVVETE